MKSIIFFSITLLLTSCKVGQHNFSKQKFTDLKPIKNETTSNQKVDVPASSEEIASNYDDNGSQKIYEPDEVDGISQVNKYDNSENISNNQTATSVTKSTEPHERVKTRGRKNKKRIQPINKENEPDWKKARNNGFWMFGLSGFLIGAGLGLAILIWAEFIFFVFIGLAAIALGLAFFFWIRAIKLKHGPEIKKKKSKIWSIVLFPSSLGLAYLGIYIAFITTFEIWLFVFLLIAVAAFVFSILFLIRTYKGTF